MFVLDVINANQYHHKWFPEGLNPKPGRFIDMRKKYIVKENKESGWGTKKLRWRIRTMGFRDGITAYTEYENSAEIIYYALKIWFRLGKILEALQDHFFNRGRHQIWMVDNTETHCPHCGKHFPRKSP